MVEGLVSIVLSTYNRAHLLRRSLECYARQGDRDFELVILDDGSEDDTAALVESYNERIPSRYVLLDDKEPGKWRDAAAVINRGIKMTEGELVFITHPEVMLCFDGVERLRRELRASPGDFVNLRVYYLTQRMQEHLDGVPWREDFFAVRKIPGFYDSPDPLYKEETLAGLMNQFCTPRYTDETDVWNSWVFGGMTRAAWKKFGGLQEFDSWGSTDIDFHYRREFTGLRTLTPRDIYAIHQNHDTPFGKFKPSPKTDLFSVLESVRERFYSKKNFLEDMEL